MRIEDITLVPFHDRILLTIALPRHDGHTAQKLVEDVKPGSDYDITIRKAHAKRSLTSNAYMWVLVTKLADRLKIGKTECYRQMVKDYGISTVMPVRKDKMQAIVRAWESKGFGWMCEDLGECRKTDGYHNILFYVGTSAYDTHDFGRYVDGVVWECKAQGIETLTPQEIMAMRKEEK